jgi:hypothetical protein
MIPFPEGLRDCVVRDRVGTVVWFVIVWIPFPEGQRDFVVRDCEDTVVWFREQQRELGDGAGERA